jgi:hypothetical protein
VFLEVDDDTVTLITSSIKLHSERVWTGISGSLNKILTKSSSPSRENTTRSPRHDKLPQATVQMKEFEHFSLFIFSTVCQVYYGSCPAPPDTVAHFSGGGFDVIIYTNMLTFEAACT